MAFFGLTYFGKQDIFKDARKPDCDVKLFDSNQEFSEEKVRGAVPYAMIDTTKYPLTTSQDMQEDMKNGKNCNEKTKHTHKRTELKEYLEASVRLGYA
ncbi:hypothetical protein SprV_0200915200 [Sparganum proliferum]